MTDFKDIKAFAFDVDGVFTDGGIFCTLDGELYRTFDAKDGFSVRMATMCGYPVAIITGGRSESIKARFRTCGLVSEDIYLGSREKTEDFDNFCNKYGLDPSDVLYMGDDIPDVSVMLKAGIGACPSDAVQEAKDAADYICERPGGGKAVREVIERVMKARGDWQFDVATYKKLF
ncbi:MAG: HAD hydrolase family protein [Bacteroidales bacterium]|nr:HAD hydrolase family protein [Bacteroidales bacterium]